ncbi:MAG: hypothetical protein ACI892_001043, partial [Marinobacter maritimus]
TSTAIGLTQLIARKVKLRLALVFDLAPDKAS